MSQAPELTPAVVRLSITKSVIAHAARAKMGGTLTKELALLTDHDMDGPVSTYVVSDNGAIRLSTKHLHIACAAYNAIEI